MLEIGLGCQSLFDATQIVAVLGGRLGTQFPRLLCYVGRRQVRIQKTERVRYLDDPHSSFALLLNDLIAQSLHSRPMHLWPEMMFRMITVVKPRPVIDPAVGTHAPRNRFIWIATVMPIITIQI